MSANLKINIDYTYCKRCHICHAFCPQQVFTLTNEGLPKASFPELCKKCHLCELRCPDFAINLEESI